MKKDEQKPRTNHWCVTDGFVEEYFEDFDKACDYCIEQSEKSGCSWQIFFNDLLYGEALSHTQSRVWKFYKTELTIDDVCAWMYPELFAVE